MGARAYLKINKKRKGGDFLAFPRFSHEIKKNEKTIKKLQKVVQKRLTSYFKYGKLYVSTARGVIFLYGVLLWQSKRQEPKLLSNVPSASIETMTASKTKRTIPTDL